MLKKLDLKSSQLCSPFFLEGHTSKGLEILVGMYVHRSYHIWKDPALLPWLERNVNSVLEDVQAQTDLVKDCATKRKARYQVWSLTQFYSPLLKSGEKWTWFVRRIEPIIFHWGNFYWSLTTPTWYQGTPKNILRHVIISDVKEVASSLPRVSFLGGKYSAHWIYKPWIKRPRCL